MNLLNEPSQSGSFSCPECGELLQVKELQGHSGELCPHCGHSFASGKDITLPHKRIKEPEQRKVAHFLLEELLGSGSFGSVWLAKDKELDRQIALKLPRVVDGDAMMLHEAKTAAKLNHPNIVTVHEVGKDGDQIYIASEYIEGTTLGMAMKASRLKLDDVVQLLIKLAAAAAHAHGEGIIHRDLKPSNVLLNADGEPVVADFGIAKLISAEETISSDGAIVGTIGYMSPEQAMGWSRKTDHRADIYALGVIMFEMLTGNLPFRGNIEAIIRQKSSEDPPSPRRLVATIPADLETICLKCLERERNKRYQSARDLEEELERFRQDRPILARPISTLERGLRWCRRQPVVAGLLAGIFLSLAVGLASSSFLWFRAEDNAAMTRQELYRSQLNLTGMRWANGDLTGVNDILNEPPVPALAKKNNDFAYRYFSSALTSIRQIVNHGESLSDVAVSHDGALFASAEKANVIRVWNSHDGRLLRTLRVASGEIASIEFAPSDNRLASSHKDGKIRLWIPLMHDQVLKELDHGPGLSKVRFVPGSTSLVSTGGAGSVQIWNADVQSDAVASVIRLPYEGDVVDARTTRDGRRLAVACENGRVSIFNLKTHQLEQDLPPCKGVLNVSFVGPEEQILAAGSRLATCRFYSLDSGQIIYTLRGDGAIGDTEYLHGIRRLALASSGQTLKLYDDQYRIRNSISTHVRTYGLLAQSTDGSALAVGSDDGTVKLLDISSFGRPSILWHGTSLRDVVFLSNKRIASCGQDGAVISWDLDTGERRVLREPTGSVALSLSVVDSGRRLAVAGAQRSVDLLEAEPSDEPVEKRSVPLPFPNIAALAYHEQKDLLAVGGLNGWVQVYRYAASGEPLWETKPSDATVHGLCFSKDRSRLAVAYSNRTILIADFLDNGQVREARISVAKEPTSITTYDGGRMIAVGTKTGEILLVPASGEAPIRTIKCHGSRINSVAVLPNETQIASGGMDRNLQLWDLNSGKGVSKFWGHQRQIFAVAAAPDGQTIVSVGLEGDLRIWRGADLDGQGNAE